MAESGYDAIEAGLLSSDGLDDKVNRSLAIVAGSLLVPIYYTCVARLILFVDRLN